MPNDDPHANVPMLQLGAPPAEADLALVLLHGRGADARDMAGLAQALTHDLDARVTQWLPEAAERVWYPQRFVAPRAANQPWLDSALARVEGLLGDIERAGIPPENIVLGGFSQGACLALESFARGGRRLGGVVAYAGGLIGETLEEGSYPDGLGGTPVFLGSADPDPHIPTGRVAESAELLRAKGAEVDMRLYPGIGHTINEDELQAGQAIVRAVAAFAREDRAG